MNRWTQLFVLLLTTACSYLLQAQSTPAFYPPLSISMGRITDESEPPLHQSGSTVDPWPTEIRGRLGITIHYLWNLPSAEASLRINAAILSGNLPDIMAVDPFQYRQLVDKGLIADLAPVFAAEAEPLTREVYGFDHDTVLAALSEHGHLFGLPRLESRIGRLPVIWIREDWLARLGLQGPKNLDELVKIATAFVKRDPDANGKADTIGFSFRGGQTGGLGGIESFFLAYHSMAPDGWVQLKNGQFHPALTLAETRAALGRLTLLYKAGIIDPDFAVKNELAMTSDIINDRVGIVFGPPSIAINPLQASIDRNSQAIWRAYPLVSADKMPVLMQAGPSCNTIYVVRKGFAHPEVLIRLINLFLYLDSKASRGFNPQFHTVSSDESGPVEVFRWAPVQCLHPELDLSAARGVALYFAKGRMENMVDMWLRPTIRLVDTAISGDRHSWYASAWAGPGGALEILDRLRKQGQILLDGPAAAGLVPMPQLDERKLFATILTGIITGNQPVGSYDVYSGEWFARTGAHTTFEVNLWQKRQ